MGEKERFEETIAEIERVAASDITHRSPIDDSGETPCCGKSPVELSYFDHMTEDSKLVTCGNYSQPAIMELQEIWERLRGSRLNNMPDDTEAWWEIWGCADDGREGKYPAQACMFCLVRNALKALGVEVTYGKRREYNEL